jgi:hypothetical protein
MAFVLLIDTSNAALKEDHLLVDGLEFEVTLCSIWRSRMTYNAVEDNHMFISQRWQDYFALPRRSLRRTSLTAVLKSMRKHARSTGRSVNRTLKDTRGHIEP